MRSQSCFHSQLVLDSPVLLTVRLCLAVFEQYQKSRMQFVQNVADLAARPQNIEVLQNAGKKHDDDCGEYLALAAIPTSASPVLLQV